MEVLEDEVVLTCKAAEKGDAGRYQVTLKNAKGSDSVNVNVNILGRSHNGVTLRTNLTVGDMTAVSVVSVGLCSICMVESNGVCI